MTIPERGTVAISSEETSWLSTPIKMPSGSTVIIEGLIKGIVEGDRTLFPLDASFADFTSNKTGIKRVSGTTQISYNYYGNDWYEALATNGKDIAEILLKVSTSTMEIQYCDGTSAQKTTTSRSWPAKTTNFRVCLRPNYYISRLLQINSSNAIVHELLPTTNDGQVCMVDTVTGQFYTDANLTAYLTTI